MALQVHCL